jgi:hypothetical protein
MIIRTRKYLELDSTFRNRVQYPNPSDFAVPFQISGSYNNCIDAFDPVCLSAPVEQAPGAQLVVPSHITLVPLISSAIHNYYVKQYIGLIDTSVTPHQIQYSKIDSYDGTTRAITTMGSFTIPNGTYMYTIRKQLPAEVPYNTNTEASAILSMTAIMVFTPLSIQIQPSLAHDDAYKGMCLRLISFTPTFKEEYQNIVSYDSATHTVHVSKPFTHVFTANDYYELLPFSRDNLKPMKSQGSMQNQAVCYAVRLSSISIPKIVRTYTNANGTKGEECAIIDVANGGTIDQYPYYYICLYSDIHKDNIQSFMSNNPNTSYATFRVVDGRCDMSPIIKFLPNDTFHMTILLPNGEILSFKQKDTVSPKEPNTRLQITALFEFMRMDDK